MPKKLLLIRHAQALESTFGQKDFDRTLTNQGIIDASHLGAFIFKSNLYPDAFYSSMAERAKITANSIADKINFDINKIKWEKNLYETSPRAMLNSVNEFEKLWEIVAILGHNPVITYFAEYLTGELIGSIKPAGLVVIAFDIKTWSEVTGGTGRLESKFQPKQ